MNHAKLQDKLNYSFKNKELLLEALTHSSYAYEHSEAKAHNERLEFLGDAVLQLAISSALYQRENLSEGSMTKLRARVVCEPTLAQVARQLDLQTQLRLGHGEALSGGADNDSNLANAMEAVLGAIFIDSGYDACFEVSKRLFEEYIDLALEGKLIYDYKSYLLEAAHKEEFVVDFRIIDQSGPDHDRRFTAAVFIDGKQAATAEGKTKKEAEQGAAAAYIEQHFHNTQK
ncbi:MAG: ribonuclease III [Eubacteriales bacterium]|nr:ribonuclease III [Eubacteriales bacterium]MDD4323563.1 ribonuclease III [Eubacteriales bacterium]MDD4541558.1 ribonuclease III [Eubacteriales bacterium]